MYVIVVMRVNSPCRFLLFVDTSFQMTPLESSRFFTFLGFLISNALQASARQNHTLPSFTITLSFPKLLLLKFWLPTKCVVYCSCYTCGGVRELLQCEMFCKSHIHFGVKCKMYFCYCCPINAKSRFEPIAVQ